MIQRKEYLLSLLFLALLGSGLCTAQSNETANYSVTNAANDLGLKTFSAALDGAGLADTLDNQGVLLFGNGSFAVFAPNDEAFANVTGLDINSVMENRTDLRRVLGYHVVWNDGLFSNISQVSSLKTMEGENLTINNENGLKVNGADVLATKGYDNGTIYVIDEVLVPKKNTAAGAVETANDLGAKKFASAIKAAGLVDQLNGQGLLGIASLSEGPFTIFAPSDAAFDDAKTALDAINKKEGGMKTLLSYHMVDVSALQNMTDLGSVKTLEGDSLAVDEGAGLVGGASILKSERYDNGIVYVIDQVLIPVRLSM
jgi:uncharacterized surface protein with fasciclin (FAS1) repeats